MGYAGAANPLWSIAHLTFIFFSVARASVAHQDAHACAVGGFSSPLVVERAAIFVVDSSSEPVPCSGSFPFSPLQLAQAALEFAVQFCLRAFVSGDLLPRRIESRWLRRRVGF